MTYQGIHKTMEVPMVAYLIEFTTDAPAFQAATNAPNDKAAYFRNRGVDLVWETAFCKRELKTLMRSLNVNLVTGQLVNARGDVQFLASCTRD
jgi:hypothetical protein